MFEVDSVLKTSFHKDLLRVYIVFLMETQRKSLVNHQYYHLLNFKQLYLQAQKELEKNLDINVDAKS